LPPLTIDPWPGVAIRVPFASLQSLLEARNDQTPVLVAQRAIASAYSTLTAIGTAPTPRQAAHELAAKVVSGQTADPLIALRLEAASLPKPINGVFRDLYANSWSTLLALSLEQAQTIWSQDVAPVCEQVLAERYPFVTSSGGWETTLRDFTNFFGPGGLMERYVASNLAMFTQVGPGDTITVSSQNGLALNLSRDVLREVNLARRIRAVYFGGDGSLQVRFTLTPSYLDPRALSATFSLDQTQLVDRHDPPRTTQFTWPSNGEAIASLSVETLDGMRPEIRISGPWAVFHLLDQATLSPGPTRDQFQLMFKVGDIRVGYIMRASSVLNPLSEKDVREFRCVPRL
jgi:type VI secretion system protein ImpL